MADTAMVEDRRALVRQAFFLEYVTLAWMTIEASVAIISGIAAQSITLLAFGIDSLTSTSRSPRRNRRTASGRPADECTGVMARLDAAPAVHWHMPFHHERIIGRRHHTHAGDRQVNGQPSPPRRSRRTVMQRSRRANSRRG